jgi:toxin CcdB
VPQFRVYRNRNAATKACFPLLLDVQTDLLEDLGTRVVIPMAPAAGVVKRSAMRTLTPVCDVDGKEYVLVTPQLAGIATKELGPAVCDLAAERASIIAALDLLLTGI